MRAYRDPATGAFTAPPPAAPAPGGVAPLRAAPVTPLTETAAPGGGTMMRLNGAFLNDFTATRGKNGVGISCSPSSVRR
jgi:hypothetical protein